MKYIMFFGSIGVGKTTLGKYIGSQIKESDFIEEYLEDNLFLDKFYNDMKKYAFQSTLEMLMLMVKNYEKIDMTKNFTIFDNGVEELICYNRHMLEEKILSLEEFSLYQQYYQFFLEKLPKTDLYVFVKCDLEEQKNRINKRNREYEKSITTDFLIKLNNQYEKFVSTLPQDRLWIVDTSDGFSFEKFKREFEDKISNQIYNLN